MPTANENTKIRGFLKRQRFYWVSGDRRSTEYGHDTAKIVVQLLASKDGAWAILTDGFDDIASGHGFAAFEKRFTREIKKAA